MTFVQKTINDETVFPTKHGVDFPSTFDSYLKKTHRLLFHVMAHIYHAHFKEIVLLQLHAHLNAVFAHFIEFNMRFQTVEEREIEVLEDLVVALRLARPRDGDDGGGSGGGDGRGEGGGGNGNNNVDHPISAAAAAAEEAQEENKENGGGGSAQQPQNPDGRYVGVCVCGGEMWEIKVRLIFFFF